MMSYISQQTIKYSEAFFLYEQWRDQNRAEGPSHRRIFFN